MQPEQHTNKRGSLRFENVWGIKQGSVAYKPSSVRTGAWRRETPISDNARCTRCMACARYCPPGAIRIDECGCIIDYEFCKGCGICTTVCPRHAISMVKGGEAQT